jgi:hypothetical protein
MRNPKAAANGDSAGLQARNGDGPLAMHWISLGAATRLNAQFYRNATLVQVTFLEFTRRRLAANFEVARNFSGRRRLEEAAGAVCSFQREAVADYAEQARHLVKMCTAMTGGLIQEIEDTVSESTAEASGLAKISTSRAGDLLIREIENLVAGGPAGKSDAEPRAMVPGNMPVRSSGKLARPDAGQGSAVRANGNGAHDLRRAEAGDRVSARGPVISLKALPREMSEADLQKAIVRVLEKTGKAMTLAEIASQIGPVHYSALIRPARTLCAMARIVKDDKSYRLP